jgi:hypothetical protein
MHTDEGDRGVPRRAFLGTGLAALAVVPVLGCSDDTPKTANKPRDGGAVKLDKTKVAAFPRSQHATALLPGGLILLIGGLGGSGMLTSCQVYDPDDDAWYDAAPLARARGLLSATPTGDGNVLCLGGFDGSNPLGVGSVFDPAKDVWESVKPLTTPRYHHAAQTLDDGRVVVTGGFNAGPLATPEIYEP